MFISNQERLHFKQSIEKLFRLLDGMITDTIELRARIKVLEGTQQQKKKKRNMSPENRAKMSQMMKARHAKKKMEKQNGNSVNTTSV